MYEEYFGLKENPFSIAPDTHYFYMSDGHREALAHLVYGIERDGGFVLLTGEVGTGKTTVCRCLLERMPETTEVAFILNPKLTVEELLATICDEFGIGYPAGTTSIKVFVALINDYLLDLHARGRRAVLIIEEAQNFTVELLEQIRLLTNLETNERKLLQIIMLGQPEIREMLSQPQLRQLSQRITARYHLGPLSRKEIPAYVHFRLSTAGSERSTHLFPAGLFRKLYRLTGGVPRLINVICDRALLGAYVQGKDRVDVRTLRTAAREVVGNGHRPWPRWKLYQAIGACLLLVLCAVFAAAYFAQRTGSLTRFTFTEAAGKRDAASRTAAEVTSVPQNFLAGIPTGTKEKAYEELFRLWQVEYRPEDSRTVCEQARAQGLRCLEGKGGSISALRQTNKPAALRLLDAQRGEFFATLTSLEGERATCVINSETRTLDVEEISGHWSGEYLLLWRVPSDYIGKLKEGRRGPHVAWLDRQLAVVQGRAVVPGREPLYDEELVKQVKEFQRAAGLTPDGITGRETLTLLTAAAGDGGPALVRTQVIK